MNEIKRFTNLGYVSWLWMNSGLHANWKIWLLKKNIIPAVYFDQIEVLVENNIPVAYASWAFFSSESEKNYIRDATSIEVNDWTSGDRLWFIDFISPISVKHTMMLKSKLRSRFPDRYARALRVKPGSDKGTVVTFWGREIGEGWKDKANADILENFYTGRIQK